jgi:hypothetical protein
MDIADAYKHHRPDRPSATVDVSFAVTTSFGGDGELRYGNGKYGGIEQTIVTRKTDERRALFSILQNVLDASRQPSPINTIAPGIWSTPCGVCLI